MKLTVIRRGTSRISLPCGITLAIEDLRDSARGAISVKKISTNSVFFAEEGKAMSWNKKILRSSATFRLFGLKST